MIQTLPDAPRRQSGPLRSDYFSFLSPPRECHLHLPDSGQCSPAGRSFPPLATRVKIWCCAGEQGAPTAQAAAIQIHSARPLKSSQSAAFGRPPISANPRAEQIQRSK